MADYYDKNGNYVGKKDSNGNFYDIHSNYVGRVDSEGKFYDPIGNYPGRRIQKEKEDRFRM